MKDHVKKAVLAQIVNSAMLEVVLDTYPEIKMLNVYDDSLRQKLRNLKPSLEKQSKINYDLLSKTTDEIVLRTYYRTQNAFEVITRVALSGDVDKFGDLIRLLELFDKDEIVRVTTKEDEVQESK